MVSLSVTLLTTKACYNHPMSDPTHPAEGNHTEPLPADARIASLEPEALEPDIIDAGPDTQRLAIALANGERLVDAAQRLNLDLTVAAQWVQQPWFLELVAQALPPEESIRQRFVSEASQSVRVLQELRDLSPDPKIRLAAAKDLLDRAGFTPIRKVATVNFSLRTERKELLDATASELLAFARGDHRKEAP